MALILTHKVNQGVHVEGRGLSLDLIVRDIRGDYSQCEADIEVRSSTGSRFLQISADGSQIFPLEEFGIELIGKHRRHSVKIAYTADWDYQIRRKDYGYQTKALSDKFPSQSL